MLWSWNKEYNAGIFEVRFDGASPSARTFKHGGCKAAETKLQKQIIYKSNNLKEKKEINLKMSD